MNGERLQLTIVENNCRYSSFFASAAVFRLQTRRSDTVCVCVCALALSSAFKYIMAGVHLIVCAHGKRHRAALFFRSGSYGRVRGIYRMERWGRKREDHADNLENEWDLHFTFVRWWLQEPVLFYRFSNYDENVSLFFSSSAFRIGIVFELWVNRRWPVILFSTKDKKIDIVIQFIWNIRWWPRWRWLE